jgi:hypothetical protein
MGSWLARVLIAASIASTMACGKRHRPPVYGGDAPAGGAPGVHSRYREMTWAEYYAEVTDRVWKRGGTVVWISPPSVRKVKRDGAPVAE